MAAPQCTVRWHRRDDAVTFQVIGWGRMGQSLPLRRFAEDCLADGVRTLRVDLRHCSYLDSTFLGTLLYLRRAAQKRGAELVLVSPAAGCTEVFRQTGVGPALPQVAAEEAAADWNELCAEGSPDREFQENVLRAHQELAALDGPAAKKFEGVVRCLAQELGPKNP